MTIRYQHLLRELKSLVLSFFLVSFSALSFAAAPQVLKISDQNVQQGGQLVVTPMLGNPAAAGTVNWSKAYGHDDVDVNPINGTITWQIPSDLPSESFHLGLKASNLDGAVITNFIIHVGVDKIVYVGPNEAAKNFVDAFAFWLSPGRDYRDAGTTFIVRDGTYSGVNGLIGLSSQGWILQPPSGTPSKMTTVMAENPGKAVLTDGGGLTLNSGFGQHSYIAMKGFHVEAGFIGIDGSSCRDLSCEAHHIKFIQNGVNMKNRRGGFGISRANHILVENNYSYGGTRVRFNAYKASKTVFRRNVGRFDFDVENTGPKNTFSFYTSMDIAGQNNIAIDADAREFIIIGELAGEFGCPTTAGDSRISYDRNIQLNSDLLLSNFDATNGICMSDINDLISWDNRAPNGALIRTRAASLINHGTFGDINPPTTTGYLAFAGWPGTNTRGFMNSVLHNFSTGPLFYGYTKGQMTFQNKTFERFGVHTLNISNFNGSISSGQNDIDMGTITNLNPIWSKANPNGAIRYIVRAEPNSNLSKKAKDGTDLGARVMTFKGKSGTFWGEPGWNSETSKPAWPFPYQDTIANKMRAMVHIGPTWIGGWNNNRTRGPEKTLSGNRGFAQVETDLTDYIWGYLGSLVPPMNVGARGGSESAIIRWDIAAPQTQSAITSYKVYDYNPQNQAVSNGRAVGLTNSMTITGLTNDQDYHFVVTAVSKDEESGWSYPVSVRAQTSLKPLPPTASPI